MNSLIFKLLIKYLILLKYFIFLNLIAIFLGCNKSISLQIASTENYIEGESFVLSSNIKSNFLYTSLIPKSLKVYSTYSKNDSNFKLYKEKLDYIVDYNNGTITRTKNSSIPDYSNHIFYSLNDFDQNNFTNFSNDSFFIYADYSTFNSNIISVKNKNFNLLKNFKNKLLSGDSIQVISYGNSITAGAGATSNEYRFQYRWLKYLKNTYPKSNIYFKDVSIPGYSSKDGILLWDNHVGLTNPDLVLLGWGMNDANLGGATPLEFKNNLKQLVKMIRELKHAEVIIYSQFRPNDNWHYSSHSMYLFANAAKEAAAETNSAYVDVFNIFELVFKRKNQSSILQNNINHPNNFGHFLYFQTFKNMQF